MQRTRPGWGSPGPGQPRGLPHPAECARGRRLACDMVLEDVETGGRALLSSAWR
ncbi:hypothetical protein QJS66_03675 [Kocuria rhizophila]|nr:hypothetical protein QJS66_03675 [Kocuria rhizophila]